MNIISNLTPITDKSAKRVGRGIGSGVGGHTTGRGAKGDNVRGHGKLTFDGTKIKKSWLKRTPFLRGKHRTLPLGKPVIISLSQIEKNYKTGEIVTLKNLFEKFRNLSLIGLKYGIKILANGELTKALTFKGVFVSKKAESKIVASGGKIET
jgi:large subunit ribosomal protein L15